MSDSNDEKKGQLTVTEAGRRGGQRAKELLGTEHYRRIGKMGGKKVAERGREFFATIGKQGGDKVKATHDVDFYKTIGKMGGDKVAERGREFYKEIGRKGGAKVKALIEAGRKAAKEEEESKGEALEAPLAVVLTE